MSDFLINPHLDRAVGYGDERRSILSLAAAEAAHAAIAAWDGYEPTPLRDLPAIADRLDLAQLLYKDEGRRFGLKSFKALGGAYAVDRLVAARGKAGLTVTEGDELVIARCDMDLGKSYKASTFNFARHREPPMA